MKELIILDGGMGTMLQNAGLGLGERPEIFGMEHPEILEKLQRRREKLEQRLEKQNPEGARRLHQWEQELRQKREESS